MFGLIAWAVAAANSSPLDRVPADAATLVHVRVGDILKSPLAKDALEALGKDAAAWAGDFRAEFGFDLADLDAVTLWHPNFPATPAAEDEFVVVVTTAKPLPKAGPLRRSCVLDAKEEDGFLPLDDGTVLHRMNGRTFAVVHPKVLAEYKKSPAGRGPRPKP